MMSETVNPDPQGGSTEMAPPRNKPNLVVSPPTITRPRKDGPSTETLAEMAEQMSQGWVTNGETYKTKKLASNAAQIHRRYLARQMQLPNEKALRSRVWDNSGKNDADNGEWIFAITRREENGEGSENE